jgi:hypothetical protein
MNVHRPIELIRRCTTKAMLMLVSVFACAIVLLPSTGHSAELVRDKDFWYVPDHEQYGRSEFFSEPSFRSSQVKVTRTQRFRYLGGQRGWAQLEFEGRTRAFIHLRILRTLMHDPGAIDPWYEYRRASVFAEEPDKIEARLKPARTEPSTTDSKLPVWKRYKEAWSINKDKGRERTADGVGDSTAPPARRAEKKSRNPYPLLPPIGSQPADAASGPESPEPDAAPGTAAH